MSEGVLADFRLNARSVWSQRLEQVPRAGDWVRLGEEEGLDERPIYAVQKVEWLIYHRPMVGERQEAIVHLRRLHPGERGNDFEPSGYEYEEEPGGGDDSGA